MSGGARCRAKKPKLTPYTPETEDDTIEYQRHRMYGIQDGNVVLQSTQFISSSPLVPLPPELPEVEVGSSGITFDFWHECPNEPEPHNAGPEIDIPTIKPKRTAGVCFVIY
jgi:hypothetical protein